MKGSPRNNRLITDEVIREAVRQEIESIPVPPGAKQDLIQKIRVWERRARWKRYTRRPLLTAVVLMALAFAFSGVAGRASLSVERLWRYITRNETGSITRIQIGGPDSLPNVTSSEEAVGTKFDSLAELQKNVPFTIRTITRLPAGLHLESGRLLRISNIEHRVELIYRGPDGVIKTSQTNRTSPNTARDQHFDDGHQTVTIVESTNLSGVFVAPHEPGQIARLFWADQHFFFDVSGPFPKEVLNAGRSMMGE